MASGIERMAGGGAGPRAIYDALRLEEDDFDGSYDAVKRFWRRLRRNAPPTEADVAIPVATQPGEVAQVDFFYVGKVLDPAQARARKCWAFVMLLAHSRHMFVDLVFDQRVETWLGLHTKAFVFFGGVPAVVVPDNLKAAVIRAAFDSSGEIALNRRYEELARYYDFHIDPTPAYAPKKKGKVERAGQYVRDNYIKPRVGQDIHELRAGLRPRVMEIADTQTHGATGRQPLDAFHEDELPAMKPCPALPFATVIWHRAKVHADSHVHLRTHLYSVPWAHLHQHIWIRATDTTVVVLAEDDRVATHKRRDERGRSTGPGHLLARVVDAEGIAARLAAHRFPLALAERALASLSPGERTRAALIALFERPRLGVLVLDEPTRSLDLVGAAALTEALRAWGGGLVVASHDRGFIDALQPDETLRLPR